MNLPQKNSWLITGNTLPSPPKALILCLLTGCRMGPAQDQDASLKLPKGFTAQVFAEAVGPARHLAVRSNGDVYVRLARPEQGKTLVALRDSNGDGRADIIQAFGDGEGGTGIAITDKWLYFSDHEAVYRQALDPQQLVPTAQPERIVTGLGDKNEHNARTLALDNSPDPHNPQHLYVNVGSPSNSCQLLNRIPAAPGQDPCPQLKAYAGIWRFDANKLNQDKLSDGLHFATGVRNAVALDWHPSNKQLYIVQHGRDMLHEGFWQYYSATQGEELPGEEFTALQAGANLGWPYCYYDPVLKRRVLAPEYGGNGGASANEARCKAFTLPLMAFPAHAAPNDLLFYTGKSFPPEYQQGAFIALHGSSHRTPEQRGYQVVFLPLQAGKSGPWRVFADGFTPSVPPPTPGEARYRPMSLGQLPDGSLLIGDSIEGRIWKVGFGG